MEKNYPKMLYKGDQSNFQHIIAENSELERQLKDQGWQEHAELKEPDPVDSNGLDIGFTDQESFQYTDGVSQAEYDEVVSQRDSAVAKITELEEQLANEKRDNASYRKTIRYKEIEDLPADDLRQILDDRKITYGARTGKPELVSMVLESEEKLNEGADNDSVS
ncbi:hypothetical protein [Acinetobacter radioresistens]|uniref:hypothetical protein n=1 Tax=Acinetobacter radioresistens TaxID=40216 RepID=UPI003B27E9DF